MNLWQVEIWPNVVVLLCHTALTASEPFPENFVRRRTAFKVLRPHYGNMASSCYYNAHKHGLSPSPFGEYLEPPVPFSLSLARRRVFALLVHAAE